MENTTLIQEIEKFGEVREGGCILRIEGGCYKMEVARNLMKPKHTLAINTTDEARLEAHWAGFVEANR